MVFSGDDVLIFATINSLQKSKKQFLISQEVTSCAFLGGTSFLLCRAVWLYLLGDAESDKKDRGGGDTTTSSSQAAEPAGRCVSLFVRWQWKRFSPISLNAAREATLLSVWTPSHRPPSLSGPPSKVIAVIIPHRDALPPPHPLRDNCEKLSGTHAAVNRKRLA